MNKKEIKNWVDEAIKKGYDRTDVIELMEYQIEKGLLEKGSEKSILDSYDERFEEVERTKVGFFQRRKLRKNVNKVREVIDKASIEIQKLTSQTKELNKKENLKLEKLRREMIDAVVGDIEKKKSGLNNIFDIDDEKTGKPIDRETLETYTLDEIEELLRELLDALEKEI